MKPTAITLTLSFDRSALEALHDDVRYIPYDELNAWMEDHASTLLRYGREKIEDLLGAWLETFCEKRVPGHDYWTYLLDVVKERNLTTGDGTPVTNLDEWSAWEEYKLMERERGPIADEIDREATRRWCEAHNLLCPPEREAKE